MASRPWALQHVSPWPPPPLWLESRSSSRVVQASPLPRLLRGLVSLNRRPSRWICYTIYPPAIQQIISDQLHRQWGMVWLNGSWPHVAVVARNQARSPADGPEDELDLGPRCRRTLSRRYGLLDVPRKLADCC